MNLPAADIPTTVVGAQEIERLVPLTDTTPSSLLLERAADPDAPPEGARNPVLDQGRASYPWATARLSTTPDAP